jgi:di/tricarboxylate transporter
MSRRFSIRNYLADIIILKDSPNIGKRIMDAPLVKELDLEVLEVRRNGNKFNLPPADFIFEEDDELRVRCDLDKIKRLKDRAKINIKATGTETDSDDEQNVDTTILELIITANSELEGKTLEEVEFKRKYRAIPLAIQHRNEILHEQLEHINLKAGDIILAEVKTHRLPKFKRLQSRQESPFIIISEEGLTEFKALNFWIVVACVLGVVILAATNVLNIMIGAIAASGILVATKTITMKDTYASIDWTVIFLLGGALSLGKGMENSGLAQAIADGLVTTLGTWGPHIILASFYLITIIFTEIMSNNATAALMAPIAIVTAHSLGVSPIPFLMAVTFAASASFLTPVGYQTNTMIYGAGQYRFSDFGKTGAILSFVLWIVISWSIPYFFPF